MLSFLKTNYHMKKALQSGSATVEAAVIMPAVLFFFLSIFTLIDLFRIHGEIGGIINSYGEEKVALSYPFMVISKGSGVKDESLTTQVLSTGWTELALRNKILNSASGKRISNLTCLFSNISNGEINLEAVYTVELPIEMPGFQGFILTNHFYSKAYVGYIPENSEERVYITRNSEVYHTYKDCTALKSKIDTVLYSALGKKRNKNGAKYYPCEDCYTEEIPELVYITPHGTRFHTRADCPQLSLTIYEIPLSEKGDRRLCYYCKVKGTEENEHTDK